MGSPAEMGTGMWPGRPDSFCFVSQRGTTFVKCAAGECQEFGRHDCLTCEENGGFVRYCQNHWIKHQKTYFHTLQLKVKQEPVRLSEWQNPVSWFYGEEKTVEKESNKLFANYPTIQEVVRDKKLQVRDQVQTCQSKWDHTSSWPHLKTNRVRKSGEWGTITSLDPVEVKWKSHSGPT